MKILLTNSPAYIKDMNRHFTYGSRFACSDPIPYEKKIKDHYVAYPWSLGYGSSILKQNTDLKVKALDAHASDYNEKDFLDYVKRFSPDLMTVDLPTISFSLNMELLREIKNELGCKIIVTGLHASGLPKETLRENPFIDYVIAGEYELSLPDLIMAEEDTKKLNEIPNLYYRDDAKISFTKVSKPHVDFDSLPYPDREDLPIEHYHDLEVAGKPTVQMLTSRGCPHTCTYCCTTVMYPKGTYWKRSAGHVVDEMEYVKEKYCAKQIYFDDDLVTVPTLHQMSSEILKRCLDLPWTFMGDINIGEKTLKLITKAGAVGVKFGVESINPNVLGGIDKGWVSGEKTRKFVRLAKKYGLWTHGHFIVGLPQDTRESILKTLDFALDLDLDSAQFYILTPLPGSPFYRTAEENGWLITHDWQYFDGNNHSTINYPWLSKEDIEELIRVCKRKWELTAFKRYIKSPSRMIRYVRGRGVGYTLRKVRTLLTNKGHILTAGL